MAEKRAFHMDNKLIKTIDGKNMPGGFFSNLLKINEVHFFFGYLIDNYIGYFSLELNRWS